LCDDSIAIQQFSNDKLCEIVLTAGIFSRISKLFKSTPKGMSADTANLIPSALEKPKCLFEIGKSGTLVLYGFKMKAFEKLKEGTQRSD